LGLSMVYGFAKQSGGAVTIKSRVGHGTTVTLFLPHAEKTMKPAAVTPVSPDVPSIPRTVLVVEDEAEVRGIVRRQLEGPGHRVRGAGAATEARLRPQGPADAAGLLPDVVLGSGRSGIAFADAARGAGQGRPIIFMPGYTAVPGAQRRFRETGAPLLTKP